ncbi:MAG: hypothetical protein J2P49_02140 [Methylocapsa sp.]|nr:hypothetical protein [Methylocapsa sp.]
MVQKPLATVVIGGSISATLLALLVLPALYARFGKPGVAVKGNVRRAIKAGKAEKGCPSTKGVLSC